MIPLILLAILITGSLTFALGQHLGYSLGYDTGRFDAEAHADDPIVSDIRWHLAAPLPPPSNIQNSLPPSAASKF